MKFQVALSYAADLRSRRTVHRPGTPPTQGLHRSLL